MYGSIKDFGALIHHNTEFAILWRFFVAENKQLNPYGRMGASRYWD